MKSSLVLMIPLGLALVACAPTERPGGGFGDVDSGVCVASAGSETSCQDGIDDDCDLKTDCQDIDCSGVGNCPLCGMVMHPLGTPLALPDGDGAGPPYTNDLHFEGFGAVQTYASGNLQKVCVTMEHSWIRDVQIELLAPGFATHGKKAVLSLQLGNMGSEVYLGQANDDDDANNPVPGVGAEYCWSPTATNPPMLDYANMGMPMLTVTDSFGGPHDQLPPGDYQASSGFDTLLGAPLNGDWTIFVQDKWGADNGYIFEWSIAFDPTIVENCDDPVIQ